MQEPLDITFRGMSRSPSVEVAIERWVHRLERTYGRILGCSVVIEQPHRHHHQGNVFHVRVALRVPGHEFAIACEPARDERHEDVYVAVADAFRAARRRLHEHARILRGDVKHRAA